MITRSSKFVAAALVMGFAAYGHAGTAAVSPALAACSKALVATLAKTDELPAYKVKAPSSYASPMQDPNSFTVIAKSGKTLLAKASCKAKPDGTLLTFRSIPVKS